MKGSSARLSFARCDGAGRVARATCGLAVRLVAARRVGCVTRAGAGGAAVVFTDGTSSAVIASAGRGGGSSAAAEIWGGRGAGHEDERMACSDSIAATPAA